MPPTVPDDLTGLPDDDLAALADQIKDAAREIGDSAPDSDDALEQLEQLADGHARVQAELTDRNEKAAARNERVRAALEAIGQTEETGETAPVEAEAQPEPEPVAAAVEQPETLTTETEENPVTETTAPADPVAALTAARPAATAPVIVDDTQRPTGAFRNTGAINGNHKGDPVDSRTLAGLVLEQHRRFSRNTSAMGPIILASAQVDFDPEMTVTPDSFATNFTVMDRAATQAQSLVASGANCALLTPLYDVPTWAVAMSPVEDAIPTVGAPRGGIRYVEPPVWPQAQAGVRVTTGAEDADGYTTQNPPGTTDPKPCVRLECPPPLECTVDAVSACVELGNLQSTTFPELVEVFMKDLSVAQAQVKEIYYLDGIDAGSTEVNFTGTYGATRSIVESFARAAHGMRKRLHLPADAPLTVLVPDTLIPVIRTDLANDLHLGANYINVDAFQVARDLFTSYRLTPTWYYDYSADVGVHGAMMTAQSAGTLNPFPYTHRSWMFPPGTWVRLDGGTLDVGMIRDSALVETNDFRIFAEEWIQICKRGGESIALDITVCPNGTGPTPVTSFTCAS